MGKGKGRGGARRKERILMEEAVRMGTGWCTYTLVLRTSYTEDDDVVPQETQGVPSLGQGHGDGSNGRESDLHIATRFFDEETEKARKSFPAAETTKPEKEEARCIDAESVQNTRGCPPNSLTQAIKENPQLDLPTSTSPPTTSQASPLSQSSWTSPSRERPHSAKILEDCKQSSSQTNTSSDESSETFGPHSTKTRTAQPYTRVQHFSLSGSSSPELKTTQQTPSASPSARPPMSFGSTARITRTQSGNRGSFGGNGS